MAQNPPNPPPGGGVANVLGINITTTNNPQSLNTPTTPSSVVTQTTQQPISVIDAGKNIKTIPFNGKATDFPIWSDRFLTYLHLNNCRTTILGQTVIPADEDDLDPTKQADIPKINARNANNLAMLLLTMSITDATSYGALYASKTDDNPEGNCAKAWIELNNIYKPTSQAKQYELEQQFNQLALTDESKNPDEWFTELERIKLQLKIDFDVTDITEQKMIQHILYNTKPGIYATTLHILKREINTKNPPSLSSIKEEMRQVYGQSKMTMNKKKASQDMSLLAGGPTNKKQPYKPGKPKFPRQYKGDCRTCGKKGHKSVDCWEKAENKDKRPTSWKSASGAESANVATPGKLSCTYCKRTNHTVDRCWQKAKDEKKKGEHAELNLITFSSPFMLEDDTEQSLFISHARQQGITTDTFIADSGATTHMRNSEHGMFDMVDHIVDIKVGNSQTMVSTKKGKFKGLAIQKNGQTKDLVLSDVLVVPALWVNLLSITKAIKHPNVELGSKRGLITLTMGEDRITFDKEINNGSGRLLGLDIVPRAGVASVITDNALMEYDQVHEILGHPHNAVVKATAKKMGIQLKGPEHTCSNCAICKAKKTSIPKFNPNKAMNIGERVMIDISSTHSESYGNNKFWLMALDEFSGYIWSFFLKKKSDVATVIQQWIWNIQKQTKIQIRKIRCDNAGENYALKRKLELSKGINIYFEFTAPHTPQQNGTIERLFATLYGKTRSVLNGAMLSQDLRTGLWAHAADMCSKLENIIVTDPLKLTSSELFHGTNPKWTKHLRTFGEIAILVDNRKIKGKLEDRGIPCIFIGYPENHSGDVYKFFNYKLKSVLHSRDVVWIGQKYGEFISQPHVHKRDLNLDTNDIEYLSQINRESIQKGTVEKPNVTEDEQMDIIDQPEGPPEEAEMEGMEEQVDPDDEEEEDNNPVQAIPQAFRLTRELKGLDTSYNPDPMGRAERAELSLLTQVFETGLIIDDGAKIPKSYKDAYGCSD